MGMNKDWRQLLSNLAILFGLVAVVYELNLNRKLGQAELLRAEFSDILAHQFALMGDNAAEAIALARTHPEDLNDQQRLVVDAHLMVLVVRLDSNQLIANSIGILEPDMALEGLPRAVKAHFNYEYAREWWGRERQMPRPWAKKLIAAFDKELGYSD